MTDRAIGWSFVAVQALLLVALILLPGGDDVAVPGWLRALAAVVFAVGCVIAIVAGVSLGRALTATPVPTAAGSLRTDGLYRYVRHPIYTGVILIVVAVAMRSGSFATVAVAAVTIAFFGVKTRWEERRLAGRYADYPAYAARTPKFFPRGVRRGGTGSRARRRSRR